MLTRSTGMPWIVGVTVMSACCLLETVINSYFVDVQLQTGDVTQELVCGLVKGLIAVTGVLCR